MLEQTRHVFGKWRYFEQAVGNNAFPALIDIDRVWGLAKAARVIPRRVRCRRTAVPDRRQRGIPDFGRRG